LYYLTDLFYTINRTFPLRLNYLEDGFETFFAISCDMFPIPGCVYNLWSKILIAYIMPSFKCFDFGQTNWQINKQNPCFVCLTLMITAAAINRPVAIHYDFFITCFYDGSYKTI